MEKNMVFINQVLPLQERPYTAADGHQQVFASRGILFASGFDEMYGEATGDLARSLEHIDLGRSHAILGTWRARSWQDKNGQQRFDNQFIISKIS